MVVLLKPQPQQQQQQQQQHSPISQKQHHNNLQLQQQRQNNMELLLLSSPPPKCQSESLRLEQEQQQQQQSVSPTTQQTTAGDLNLFVDDLLSQMVRVCVCVCTAQTQMQMQLIVLVVVLACNGRIHICILDVSIDGLCLYFWRICNAALLSLNLDRFLTDRIVLFFTGVISTATPTAHCHYWDPFVLILFALLLYAASSICRHGKFHSWTHG
jgi:hypothetical protein